MDSLADMLLMCGLRWNLPAWTQYLVDSWYQALDARSFFFGMCLSICRA